MKLPVQFTALLLAGSLTLAVAACGTPTVDGAESRFKANKDKISVQITKQPASKVEFEKKLAEFDKEHTDIMAAGTDEEKIKKLGALNSRMEKYVAAVTKAAPAAAAGGAAAPSKKLDGAAPAKTPPAAGGKLGGGAAPAAQPASGGMGGAAAGAAAGTAAQPASGGMGGAPAPAPAQPAAGGMGGM